MLDAWFWFPDRRTAVAFREPARKSSHVLRAGPARSEQSVVQVVRPGLQTACFDAPERDDSMPSSFCFASMTGAKRFVPQLAATASDQPRILAVAPGAWDAVTVSWLTPEGNEHLRLKRLRRSQVADPRLLSAADIKERLSEPADIALYFSEGDDVGPAFTPTVASEQPQVLVTWTGKEIRVELTAQARSNIPIQLLLRDVQKLTRPTPFKDLVLTNRGPLQFVRLDGRVFEKVTVYCLAPREVAVSYREGDQRPVRITDGLIARRWMAGGFQPVEASDESELAKFRVSLDRTYAECGRGSGLDTGRSEGEPVRGQLMRRHGLSASFGNGQATGALETLPAPLFAAWLDQCEVGQNKAVVTLDQFLQWPAAAQLRRSVAVDADFPAVRPGNEDAVGLVWRRARVAGPELEWLGEDARRQIGILPYVSQQYDVSRLVGCLRDLEDLQSDDLPEVAEALVELFSPDWLGLLGRARPESHLGRIGQQLREAASATATKCKDVHARRELLRQYENRLREHLKTLARARSRFPDHARAIAEASVELAKSRAQGLAALKRLEEAYPEANAAASDVQKILDQIARLQDGVPPELLFDQNVLYAEARRTLEELTQRAQIVGWLEQFAQTLDGAAGREVLLRWPHDAVADDLEARIGEVGLALEAALTQCKNSEKSEGLVPSLQDRAKLVARAISDLIKRGRQMLSGDDNERAVGLALDQTDMLVDRAALLCVRDEVRAGLLGLIESYRPLASFGNIDLDRLADMAATVTGEASPQSLNRMLADAEELEREIGAAERRAGELKRLLSELSPSLREAIRNPADPRLDDLVEEQIAVWKDEADAAGKALLVVDGYIRNIGPELADPDSNPSILSPVTAGSRSIDRLLMWHDYRGNVRGKFETAIATLGGQLQNLLTSRCPLTPWANDSGRKIAEVLVRSPRQDGFDVLASLAKILERLRAIWRVTGGDKPDHVRDVLWLLRNRPVVGAFEAITALAHDPGQIVEEERVRGWLAETEILERQTSHEEWSNPAILEERLGRIAQERIYRLVDDAEIGGDRLSGILQIDLRKVEAPWQAINAVRKFASTSGGLADNVRGALQRYELLRP